MPSLYSADIDSIATPVNNEPATTPKRTKKNAAKKATSSPEVPPVPDVPEVPADTPPKKPLSEARKAALAKAQESRKRKREEREAEQAAVVEAAKEQEAAEALKQQQKEEKKAAQNEKRRVARLEKKQKMSTSESASEPTESAPVTPKRDKGKAIVRSTVQTETETEPPSWFKNYVKGVRKEESKLSQVKRPGKEINSEAEQHAQTQWKNGLVRDRLRNEVDSHMNKMYTMIFGDRRALH